MSPLAAVLFVWITPATLIADEQSADKAAASPSDEPTTEQINSGLLLAPKAFRAAAATVLPSVVRIESFGGLTTRGKKGRIRGISRPGDGPTTGLIISPDGYIITSTFNFIRQPPVITVVRQDGTRHVAKLLGRDETRKICLLKINDVKDLPVPKFLSPEALKIGQWAISVGVGFGDNEAALSAGIISAKNRISGRAVQTDANISPANYGGPLVDISGQVIGVCVPLHPKSKGVSSGVEWYDSGIGFAVTLAGTDELLAAMKAGKTVQPASLGVQVKAAKPDGSGAVITKVQPGSAAAKADLKKDDQILSVDEIEIQDVAHLQTVIGRFVAGRRVMVRFKRADTITEVRVTLEVFVPPKPVPRPKPRSKKPAPNKPKPGK